jgi:hypothetical protein
MMADEALLEAHREWIGYVQPVGLLVAPPALIERGVFPDKNAAPLQEQLSEILAEDDDERPIVRHFPAFAKAFLGWSDDDLAGADGGPPLPETLAAHLIEYGETLTPSFAVTSPQADETGAAWQLLIRIERLGADLDAMVEVTGRPMLAAFHMLLQVNRLFGVPEQRLVALLAESRLHQERVSTDLAHQVLAALHELLRGLAVADTRLGRTRIVELARTDPEHLYSGLLTALMRLVFVLYAEERDMFPRDEVWVRHYSLAELFKRLRDDAALYPDTMDERFGAWAQLIALWRLIHGGGSHGSIKLVARRGRLFDPDRFLFLEGRAAVSEPPDIPPVSDGVVWRILQGLLVLRGERLSYRTLDVEQIGSVYQAVMGFTIKLTEGRSIAIRPQNRGGAAATVNLDELLTIAPAKRPEWLRERTDRFKRFDCLCLFQGTGLFRREFALDPVIDRAVTPAAVGAGMPVLQPTEQRRKTGSHYTPRALTEPIVREALRPQLERLGPEPQPEQILDLKVLDPAVGSGAFLVEACRQLAEALVASWERCGLPQLPGDEDALLHARRLVAQRCLYGLDRNAMPADLAKLSLWLVTLARDHEFTFLDHAIRHGDALVGLSRDEIAGLSWKADGNVPFAAMLVRDRIAKAERERARIREAAEGVGEHELRPLLARADKHLEDVNLIGDAVVAAFFSTAKPKAREEARQEVTASLNLGGTGWQEHFTHQVAAIRKGDNPLYPFHWELQFPEVFARDNPGFDAIFGNPPFAERTRSLIAIPRIISIGYRQSTKAHMVMPTSWHTFFAAPMGCCARAVLSA